MKDISGQYFKLTPDERFRLFIEALARKDLDEADKVDESCPRKNYTMQEWEYTRKKQLYLVTALTHATELQRAVIAALMALVAFLSSKDDEPSEETAELVSRSIGLLKSKQQAWAKFCTHVGIESDVMLSAVGMNEDLASEFLMDLEIESEPDYQIESHHFQELIRIFE